MWTFNHIDFSTYPAFQGELGMRCSAESANLTVWAPTASEVIVRLYPSGEGGSSFQEHNAVKSDSGIFQLDLKGDWHGTYYTIQCKIEGEWMNEIPDPYAYAVGVNGQRGMICNFAKTNIRNWEFDKRVLPQNYTDMVLYELHIRDFSIDEFSGIENKGKYLAFIEKGTRSPEGKKTGIDHLVELGITHVHLLPIYDFFTVDESKPETPQYNWGYDPLNFNALEGSYSCNPSDGAQRIKEFKQLVQALHARGIGVIMDVVYNHTGLIFESYFNQTVPGYYYRQRRNGTFSDGSGCGTEIASERTMVRKYIIDSLLFWAREYHLDGFRFDLMGIYDIETMNTIRAELDKIDKRMVLYGEGWTGASSPMPERKRAMKKNVVQLDRIAVFSDDFRDAIKGHWSHKGSLGFASGQTLNEESVKYGIVGATGHSQINYNYVETSKWAWAQHPVQSVNYISCHDNYTLYDKLKLSCPGAGLYELSRMVCLAGSVLLTSQGIPFMHAGVEMMRTKKGNGNSYKSSDEINLMDWSRKALFSHVFEFYRKLIAIRKAHPAFRMHTTEQIQQNLTFSSHYMPGVVAYEIGEYANGDSWKNIQLIFNNNDHPIVFPVEKRNWMEVVNGFAIDEKGLCTHTSHSIFVTALSVVMLVDVG